MPDRDYSPPEAEERMVLAGKGEALPDGSFPIADRRDLEKAIHLPPLARSAGGDWGQAKDPERAKAFIRRRAKALGAEALLPTEWAVGSSQ